MWKMGISLKETQVSVSNFFVSGNLTLLFVELYSGLQTDFTSSQSCLTTNKILCQQLMLGFNLISVSGSVSLFPIISKKLQSSFQDTSWK